MKWLYYSSVEKMIKSNKPPLNFSTSLYNTYKQKFFNVFFIEISIQKYLTDCGGFNSSYSYRLAMTRGNFMMRSNIRRASHDMKYLYLAIGILFDLNWCHVWVRYTPTGGRAGFDSLMALWSSVKRPILPRSYNKNRRLYGYC